MKYHINHEIGKRAVLYVKSTLIGWVVNEFGEDYAKDCHIEIVDQDRELTGSIFQAQVKGALKLSINRRKGYATFQLERKYAIYYADKVSLPVFLFLIDVEQHRGYWIYIQHYLRKIEGLRWRNKSKVPIRVPLTNTLTDTAMLQAAVENSIRDVATSRSTSIIDVIAANKDRLESLDSRINVRIDVVKNETRMSLMPKEDIRLTLRNLGEPKDFAQKLADLYNHGTPAMLKAGDFEIAGSDLITSLLNKGLSVTFDPTQIYRMSFIARTGDGLIASRLDSIPVKVRGGAKSLTFIGSLKGTPISFSLKAEHDNLVSGLMHFSFRMRPWADRPLLRLKYFDQICEFLEGISQADRIDLECFVDGTKYIVSSTGKEHFYLFRQMAEMVTLLKKARELCRKFKIEPLLEGTFRAEDAMQVLELYDIVTKGEFRSSISGYTFKYSVPRQSLLQHFPTLKETEEQLLQKWDKDAKATLFGKEIPVGGLEMERTHLKLSESKHELYQRVMQTDAENVDIEFLGTEASEQIYRLA